MAKYHITVRDNETGEILHDCETSCIIGAFRNDEIESTGRLVAANCNTIDLAHTTMCAAQAVQYVQDHSKEVALLITLFAMEKQKGGTND